MIAVPMRALLAAGVVAIVMGAGCGGGGDEGGATTTAASTANANAIVPPAVAARASANCRDLRSQIQGLASGVIERHNRAFESLTAIVTQGIPILERIASRQRVLARAAHSPAYDRYVQLFDPIVVLNQQRLSAGETQDPIAAKKLDGLLAGLSVEQRDAARDAGLAGCDVDFRSIVTQAAFGTHQ
jgi:hypothetical protein